MIYDELVNHYDYYDFYYTYGHDDDYCYLNYDLYYCLDGDIYDSEELNCRMGFINFQILLIEQELKDILKEKKS